MNRSNASRHTRATLLAGVRTGTRSVPVAPVTVYDLRSTRIEPTPAATRPSTFAPMLRRWFPRHNAAMLEATMRDEVGALELLTDAALRRTAKRAADELDRDNHGRMIGR